MGHIIPVAAGDDQGPLLNRVSLSQYILAVTFVFLRFFTRACIVKKFGLDDLLIAIAIVLGGVQTVTIILQVENGRGRHSSELEVDQLNRMLMYKWINSLIYFVANWAVKMSILALYYRIGSGKKGLPWVVQPRAVRWIAGAMTAFHVAVFLAQLFGCSPISRAWDVERLPNGCFDGRLFMQVSGAINVATDVILLIIPLPLLPLLKFNKRQRTALALIMSIGLIPVVASTMRFCEIIMSGPIVSKDMSWQQSDSSWTWAWVPVWSQIEVDVGIIAASLPCLSPLLKLVCSGLSIARPVTPSQVPTLPGYRGSWGEEKNMSANSELDVEKTSKPEGTSYFNDAWDLEEAVYIGVAKTADARIVMEHGSPRIVDYTKI
ncbi:hypothetical protein BKA66DRAFT_433216 [Pyrenochaeta sp. MPI-SDFR-AT-0127]|nr:hypothetical protein BKA66DRAFT_433216 [Pyrenochaeta sp. MPI-SDFR-AT-0127]